MDMFGHAVLHSKFQACIAAVRIADALGAPWETRTRQEILALTDSRGVRGFHPNPMQVRTDAAAMQSGDHTDDWTLASALIRSIIRCDGYDEADCIAEFISAYDQYPFGFGSTTRSALHNLKENKEGVHTFRDHRTFAIDADSCSNGVAMRIIGIALYYLLNEPGVLISHLPDIIRRHALLTHQDPRAAVAAYTIAIAVHYLFYRRVLWADSLAGMKSQLDFIDYIISATRGTELAYGMDEPAVNITSGLVRIRELPFHGDPLALYNMIGTGHSAIQSIPFAIGVFLRNPTDFRGAVLDAINGGGDTDTNAVLVGLLVAANSGLEVIPIEWLRYRADFLDTITLADQLFASATKNPT